MTTPTDKDRARARKWLTELQRAYIAPEALATLIAEVRAETIERCAKECGDIERRYMNPIDDPHSSTAVGAGMCARRIRALKAKP